MQVSGAGRWTPLVLCVDDDPSVLALLRAILTSEGYEVTTATNGQDAVDKFRSKSVDAVVLDYEMKGMDGIEVAWKMKHLNPHVPRLMFTAASEVPQAEEAVHAVIAKTEGVKALVAILRRVIKASGMLPVAFRRLRRYSVDLPFVILADRPGGLQMYRGVAKDIGEGGIGGKVEEGALVESELVLLQVFDSRIGTPLEPRAQVRYCQDRNCGFAFLDISPQQHFELRKFCQSLPSA